MRSVRAAGACVKVRVSVVAGLLRESNVSAGRPPPAVLARSLGRGELAPKCIAKEWPALRSPFLVSGLWQCTLAVVVVVLHNKNPPTSFRALAAACQRHGVGRGIALRAQASAAQRSEERGGPTIRRTMAGFPLFSCRFARLWFCFSLCVRHQAFFRPHGRKKKLGLL